MISLLSSQLQLSKTCRGVCSLNIPKSPAINTVLHTVVVQEQISSSFFYHAYFNTATLIEKCIYYMYMYALSLFLYLFLSLFLPYLCIYSFIYFQTGKHSYSGLILKLWPNLAYQFFAV